MSVAPGRFDRRALLIYEDPTWEGSIPAPILGLDCLSRLDRPRLFHYPVSLSFIYLPYLPYLPHLPYLPCLHYLPYQLLTPFLSSSAFSSAR